MLTIQVHGVWPSSYRSFWPDYPDDPNTAFGYTPENYRAATPSPTELSLTDRISMLVLLISIAKIRRIVQMRSLVSPIRNNYIYSWSRIAEILNSDRRIVKYNHGKGLSIISTKIEMSEAKYIRDKL